MIDAMVHIELVISLSHTEICNRAADRLYHHCTWAGSAAPLHALRRRGLL